MFKRFYLIFILLFGIGGCAIQSSPDGGEKDTTPPEVLKTIPNNGATNTQVQSLVVEFDEYVEVRDFSRQFLSSPPLEGKVKHKLKGKRLTIEWEDSLKANTTYTFSFGNAIKDITEGNAQNEFKYVFSTGADLDSQHVSGIVLDAYANTPIAGALVGLYPSTISDSALLTTKPTYYSLTNADGYYHIENIKLSNYRVLAFQDLDFNFLFSGKAEKVGFPEEIISSANNPKIDIKLSKSKPAFQFYRARYKEFGQAQFFFNASVKDLTIHDLYRENAKSGFLVLGEKADTTVYWFNPVIPGDSLNLILSSESNQFMDTISMAITTKDTVKFILTNTSKSFNRTPSESLRISSSTPISEVDTASIRIWKDTAFTPIAFDIIDQQIIEMSPQLKYGEKTEILVMPGAIRDLYGRANPDSVIYKVTCPLENELAILRFNVQSLNDSEKILELFNKKGVSYRTSFKKGLNVDVHDLRPGKYELRIIYDVNQDDRWNPADLEQRIQPEKVIYHPTEIELRANWELDLNWSID